MNTSRRPVGTDNAKGVARATNKPQQQVHQHLPHEHKMGTTMKNLLLTSLTACALAAAALGLTATASAAPAGPPSVDTTISQLRAQGFEVIVNRVGTAPPEQCTVSAVRPGQTYSRTDSGVPGAGDDLVTTVISKTVYVDIRC
jgi:hypothetical protein